MKKKLMTLTILSALTACGGGGGDDTPSAVSNTTAAPAPSTASSTDNNNSQTAASTDASTAGTTNNNTAADAATGSAQSAGADDPAAIRTRLDNCPFANGSQSPNAGACLAGHYVGRDIHTGNDCSVIINRNATVTARAGKLDIQTAQSGSMYTKSRYTPIAGTSPVGYILIWTTSHSIIAPESVYTTFSFNFNSNMDGKLQIETVERKTRSGTNATSNNAISCEIPL